MIDLTPDRSSNILEGKRALKERVNSRVGLKSIFIKSNNQYMDYYDIYMMDIFVLKCIHEFLRT
jgi:hypothetical protein